MVVDKPCGVHAVVGRETDELWSVCYTVIPVVFSFRGWVTSCRTTNKQPWLTYVSGLTYACLFPTWPPQRSQDQSRFPAHLSPVGSSSPPFNVHSRDSPCFAPVVELCSRLGWCDSTSRDIRRATGKSGTAPGGKYPGPICKKREAGGEFSPIQQGFPSRGLPEQLHTRRRKWTSPWGAGFLSMRG